MIYELAEVFKVVYEHILNWWKYLFKYSFLIDIFTNKYESKE